MADQTIPLRPNPATMTVPSSKLDTFFFFNEFPAEIRSIIWDFAANMNPRNLDVWTDFVRCEEQNVVFFTQEYKIQLADAAPPAVLLTCRESREQALKSYQLAFQTTFDLGVTKIIREPKWFINFDCDILVPKGYWNIVAFMDFLSRGPKRIAVDANGSFWTDHLEKWARGNDRGEEVQQVLEDLDQLVLYDSQPGTALKGESFLQRFRRFNPKEKKDLRFEELDENEGVDQLFLQRSSTLSRMEKLIVAALKRGTEVEEIVDEKSEGDLKMVETEEELVQMPVIKHMNLIMTDRS